MKYLIILLNAILIPLMLIPFAIGFLYRLNVYAFVRGFEIADRFMKDDVPYL